MSKFLSQHRRSTRGTTQATPSEIGYRPKSSDLLRLNPQRRAAGFTRTAIFFLGLAFMLVIGFYLPATGQEEAPAEPAATEAPAQAAAQEGAEAAEAVPPGSQIVEGDYDWWEEIKKGGTTMVALGLLVVGALAFSLERLWSVRERKFAPNRFFNKILPLWKKGRFDEVAKLCRKNNSVLSQVVLYMARNYRAPYEILMHAAGDIGARELKRQFGKTFPIAVIAMLAPLLGLLGTVLGMIGAFRTVAIAGEMGDASLLAEDIGKALITTATGLIIAIPTLAIYHYFRQRISYFATEVEEQLDELTQPWLRSPEEVKQWQKNIQPVEEEDDYAVTTPSGTDSKPSENPADPAPAKPESQPAAS